MKHNLKNRPRMKIGNMDRTLFLGKEVEDWFVGFEKELREEFSRICKLCSLTIHCPPDVDCNAFVLLEEILGDPQNCAPVV